MRIIAFAALFVACATKQEPPPPPPATPPPPPVAQTIEGPGKLTLPAGGALDIPAGFRAVVAENVATLVEPDGKVEVHVVELAEADLARAIAAAWTRVDPAFALKSEQTVEPPARDGWDAIRVESYPEDAAKRAATAVARRKGDHVWVALMRGRDADMDKRAAQVRSFVGSLKVPGLADVQLADVEPKTIVDRSAELDQFIESALEKARVPGLAIAVVEGGAIVHAKGYGVKEVGKPAKIDADTLMMIGSVTKSITTLMMAMAVDEKKLAWTTPAIEAYPSFRLGDEALTKSLKMEELVCACAGLPRKDMPLILEFEKKKPEDVLAELAQMKPSTGLRETFQYQNHMVAAGGYIAGHALDPKKPIGAAYDAVMRKRVFDPLGMKRTTFDRSNKDKNWAMPHSKDLDGSHRTFPLEHERFASYVRPSGGVWSSANEMGLYLIHELTKGEKPVKQRIVSEASLMHRWEQQVAIAADVYYGLGWIVAKTKGVRMISHGGGTMGFGTLIMFLPEKGVGAVMISNGTGGHLVESTVRAKLMEMWFGIDDKSSQQLDVALAAEKEALAKLAKDTSVPDAEMMAPFLGAHFNEELGLFEVAKKKDEYWLDTGVYETRLRKHVRADGKTTLIFWDPALAGLELEATAEAGATMEINRGQERYVFKKK